MDKKTIQTQVDANAEKTVDEVFGMLYREGKTAVSIEEMDAAVRKKAQEKLKKYPQITPIHTD